MLISELLPLNDTVWAYGPIVLEKIYIFGMMFDMGNECRHQNNYVTIPLGTLAPNLARLTGHCLDSPFCISAVVSLLYCPARDDYSWNLHIEHKCNHSCSHILR